MIRSYSLAEAAEQICGDSLKDPVLWLRRQIRAGKVTGWYKAGRNIRMTEEHIAAAIKELGPGGQPENQRLGITPASLRRRMST